MNGSVQHLALLGDSIFDNGTYVPGGPAVIDQLRELLPPGSQATLLAEDGAVAEDVVRQLERLPADVTHLAISAGGNDALRAGGILTDLTRTAAEGMQHVARVQEEFRREFRRMLDAVLATRRRIFVCTVYNACPGFPASAFAGLSLFNDVILLECFRRALPVLDLRLVCDAAEDYSPLSPIEPSVRGGLKIARAISGLLQKHDFALQESIIYGAA
jgi:hypothetical protein